ncbi:M48 family metallopeptidase [Ferrovibrio sp.]|uniref:M48 family metallopeptidase n=1 Tax=Ferrovibrio sp. TaxID=1917215 RepID=UPI003D14AFCD
MDREIEGILFDGQTAAPHAVRVVPAGDALLLLDVVSGAERANWPCARIRLVDGSLKAASGAALPSSFRIALVAPDGRLEPARLRLSAEAAGFILAAVPALQARRQEVSAMLKAQRYLLAGILGVMLLLAGFFAAVPLLANAVAQVVPTSWETRLGERLLPAVIPLLTRGGRGGICTQPEGKEALQRLMLRLEMAPPPMRLPITVTVLRSPMVNAFALPGGQILITSGLLDNVFNEQALAGILAHEMGHVNARHNVAGLLRSSAYGVMLGLLLGDVITGVGLVGGFQHVLDSAFSREFEAEADEAALRRLLAAGFDPAQVAGFFDRLAEHEAVLKLPGFLSTHPGSEGRAAFFRRHQQGVTPLLPGDWQAIRGICKTVVAAPLTAPLSAPAR